MRLEGKGAVITGGAGGLGRAVALRLARAGMRVALWDLDGARVEAAAEELRRAGHQARGYALDVSDPQAVREAAARTSAELGPVQLLDNNAGVVGRGDFLDCPDAELARTIDVNVKSMFWCTKAFLPGMLALGEGHLVMMASAAGLTGIPGLAAYAASKHAVVGFAESLRLELRSRGARIGTTIVCPSFISTGMFDGVRPPRLTRWLTPEEAADLVVDAVRRGRLHVRAPWLVSLTPFLKLLPTAVLDAIGDWTRAHEAAWRGGGSGQPGPR